MLSIVIAMLETAFVYYAVKLASTKTPTQIKGMFAIKWVAVSGKPFIRKWVTRSFWSALLAFAYLVNIVSNCVIFAVKGISKYANSFVQSADDAAQNEYSAEFDSAA